jgi:GTP cyclohydrolase I
MTTPQRYATAKHDMFAGLTDILQQMLNDEEAGKSDHDVVLLVGQRLQAMVIQTERVLRGVV